MITDEEIENEVKRLSKLSTAPDKDTPDWMESDIRNGIKAGILLQQNKVSYVSAEEILNRYIQEYNITVNNVGKFQLNKREIEMFSTAMQEYASIVNESKWSELAKIKDDPKKWIEMYVEYSEMLLHDDASEFWREQFRIANNERNELKDIAVDVIEKEALIEFISALSDGCESNKRKAWYSGLLEDIEIAWPEPQPQKEEVNEDEKYTKHFKEWRDRYFDRKIKILEWHSKGQKNHYSTGEIESKYKKAMLISPFQ